MSKTSIFPGQRYGRLVVVSKNGKTKSGNIKWLCKCDCGNELVVAGGHLRDGNVRSCGCLRHETICRGIDYTGKKIGKLNVIKYAYSKDNNRYWECYCDCGNIVYLTSYQLKRNKSCGCAVRESTIVRSTKHGYSKKGDNRLNNIHKKMIDRCDNPNCNMYQYYGAKGIKVCKEWYDLKTFGDWAVTHGYRKDLTIDRINSKGNYEPSNCRWATIKEQANNKNNTVYVEIEGEKLTISQCADKYGINLGTVHSRYYRGFRGLDLVSKQRLVKRSIKNG